MIKYGLFTVMTGLAFLLTAGCGVRPVSRPVVGVRPQDSAILQLMAELQREQPGPPYDLPNNTTYNYIWAQYAMAFLALERTGYMKHEEAVERIRAMVEKAATFERHHGFFFDSYDIATGRRTSDNVYFQGWWLYALYVLRTAYPELSNVCDRLLAEVDYEKAGMFNPQTRQLAADYNVASGRVSYWIDLFSAPSGEMRTPYVVYTLLTGDVSPWTVRGKTPSITPIEGFPVLSVWHNFHFCTMLVHTEFPEVGYFERSWRELLAGLNAWRDRHQMVFFPTRAEPLEMWTPSPDEEWPNDEHGIAKPWLAWLDDVNAPVMEKAYTPGYGISLYYDNMRFYWSFGDALTACAERVGVAPDGRHDGRYRFPFSVFPLPDHVKPTTPLRLTGIRFYVSRAGDAPIAPLEIALDGEVIAHVSAREIGMEPTLIERRWDDLRLVGKRHVIELRPAGDASAESATLLYRHASNFWKCVYTWKSAEGEEREKSVEAPFLEIVLDGQREGGENAYAVLTRCAAAHGYYVWHELLRDAQFADRLVAWVGPYYNRVRLARVIHNASDQAIEVQYEDSEKLFGVLPIGVKDITDGLSQHVDFEVQRNGAITWRAEPWRTYRVLFPDHSSSTR